VNEARVELSIVIPAYNEARRIGVTLETLSDHLQAHHEDLGTVEVIVVVARGHDRTADLARNAADEFETLRVLDAGTPAGKGRDVRLGMRAAVGRYRLFMDADARAVAVADGRRCATRRRGAGGWSSAKA